MADNISLSEFVNMIKNDLIDENIIESIINNYKRYPLYIIKYISVTQPVCIANIIVSHIIKSKERRCEIIDCVLTSYGVKICDVPILSFVCNDKCICYSRECWKYIYNNFMDIIENNSVYFLSSYNVNHSIFTLISKTDILDDRFVHFMKNISMDPSNWRIILKFIKDSELYSSIYGDIIFEMRDRILYNDTLPNNKKDVKISGFTGRMTLGSVLRKYNEYQLNISKITDNIYISDITCAKNVSILRDKKINCVVTLTKKSIFRLSDIEYFQIMIDDIESVDFVGMTLDTVDKITEYIEDNRVVLVHCYKGISRSVSFVILVLIKQGMSFDDALKLIKQKRNSADPNPAFIRQIVEFVKKKT